MVRWTVRRLLAELRDAALDGTAIAHRLEGSEVAAVRDAGEVMARHYGRWGRMLEDACQQTHGTDGPEHRLQLRLC
ncbi:MAG TPA: hypothetical protein PLN42_12095 [Anaerolineae bacterium]|mgnify:CR=1 FL=1|nr:hypothetical protein [Anaerolineae bacterium]